MPAFSGLNKPKPAFTMPGPLQMPPAGAPPNSVTLLLLKQKLVSLPAKLAADGTTVRIRLSDASQPITALVKVYVKTKVLSKPLGLNVLPTTPVPDHVPPAGLPPKGYKPNVSHTVASLPATTFGRPLTVAVNTSLASQVPIPNV